MDTFPVFALLQTILHKLEWFALLQTDNVFRMVEYLAIYIVGGILANILTYLCGTAPHSLGASGSIFAIWGKNRKFLDDCKVVGKILHCSFSSRHLNCIIASIFSLFGKAQQRRLRSITCSLFGSLFMSNIDHAAHFGGFAGTILLLFGLCVHYNIAV